MTEASSIPRRLVSNNQELHAAILEHLATAQSEDPFAPVTLIVGGASQGWALRRQLVAALPSGAGIANLRIMTQNELIRTCALLMEPVGGDDDQLIRAIVVEQLLASERGPLAAAAAHKDTAQLLMRLADELAWCELAPEELDEFERFTTTTASSAVDFVRRMRTELPSAVLSKSWCRVIHHVTNQDLSTLCADLGTVIMTAHAIPMPLVDLLLAMQRHGGNVIHISANSDSLRSHLSNAWSCPDPATEVAVAVRSVAAALAAGASPQSIAVLYAADEPYAALLESELADAGIAWRGPTADSLATLTLPKVTLLLADMASRRSASQSGITRKDLMHWFAVGSITLNGERVNVARLRNFIREESLYGDAYRWRRVLSEFAAAVAPESAQEDARAVSRAQSAESARTLLAFIDAIDAVLALITDSPTWKAIGIALYEGLEAFHLDPRWMSADEDERTAQKMLENLLLRSLPRIDEIAAIAEQSPVAQLPQLLQRQFLGRRTRHGSASVGIHVGPLASAHGLVFDRIILIGAADNVLPGTGNENPLLPDQSRRVLRRSSADLPTTTERATGLAQQSFALLNSANDVAVTYSRAGAGSQGEGRPSRWFSDQKFLEHGSGLAALANTSSPITKTDIAVRDGLVDPKLLHDLLPQLAAAEAWHQPSLGHTFGLVPASTIDGRSLSASGIESFLRCPYNYFVSQLLKISTDVYSDDIDQISGSDFGTLLHTVFETFLNESLADGLPDFGGSWPDNAYVLLSGILEREVTSAREKGLVGWLPAWNRQYDTVKAALPAFFSADLQTRQEGALRPDSAEHKFGLQGGVEVPFTVDEHITVTLRGFIDRLDKSADGSQIGVVDYKSGSAKDFESSMAAATVEERTKVQDLVYDAAARQMSGTVDQVHVNFLFFPNNGEPKVVTAPMINRGELLRSILLQMQDAAQKGSYQPKPRGSRDYCPTCKLLGRRASKVTDGEDDDE